MTERTTLANSEHPVELPIQERRADILLAAARHGARNVRLFGSMARGDDHPGSDVDLLVEMEPGRSLFDHVAFQLDLERILSRPVDVVTEGGLKPRIRERVLKEAVPL